MSNLARLPASGKSFWDKGFAYEPFPDARRRGSSRRLDGHARCLNLAI